MESMGVGEWIAIVVAVGVVAILLGYWLGTKLGGHNTEPMRKLNSEHNEYKDEVREHFEQVSATMTRMVEDYREMYQHVAKGAEKLADMHHETVITPPPKPEAITRQAPEAEEETSDHPDAKASITEQQESTMSRSSRDTDPSASADRGDTPWENAAEEDTQAGGGKATSRSSGAPNGRPTASTGAALDDDKQAAGSQQPSDLKRPQDAAIRAAAEDAAHDTKR
ncbi:ZapG family protein [Salinicola aestuarinus]|uniref:ZapG family protein n=1 Tax=Salinicola aestuarinus TaxID=1949082 RepID=UPI000DA23EC0|nr:DUF1043 family protein [Salinicola aestuarinus]